NVRLLRITNVGSADMQWSFDGPPTGIARFLTVANAAGPMDPPDHGSFSFNSNGFPTPDGKGVHCIADPQVVDYEICNDRPSAAQQVAPSRWGLNVGGGSGTFASYLDRSILGRGRSLSSPGPFDYEWRFTGTSVAIRAFEDNVIVEVPFELWRTGIKTPDDPKDDVRMIPWICEAACGGGTEPTVFDIGGDHPLSGAANDPLSDWVYWMLPRDETPGEAGYAAYAEAATAGTYDYGDAEVLARQVLVSLNAGTAPPYPQPLPEPGTIFRIETAKSWVQNEGDDSGIIPPGSSTEIELTFGRYLPEPGTYRDTLTFTTRVRERPVVEIPVTLEVVAAPTAAETSRDVPSAYSLHQNYPNPFNSSTAIRFGLPHAGEVRLAVYDVLGREIEVLERGIRSAGWHMVSFEAADLPSGLYFYRIEAGSYREVRSMLLVR
ncbi:MAG: T9SS type A sorting domain-containing protein, partial [Rhodothermales bacterium]